MTTEPPEEHRHHFSPFTLDNDDLRLAVENVVDGLLHTGICPHCNGHHRRSDVAGLALFILTTVICPTCQGTGGYDEGNELLDCDTCGGCGRTPLPSVHEINTHHGSILVIENPYGQLGP